MILFIGGPVDWGVGGHGELRVESSKNQLAHSISPEDEIFTERLTECLKDKMTVDSSLLVNYFDVHQSWIPNPFVPNH